MFSGQRPSEEGLTLGRMHQLWMDTKINLFYNEGIQQNHKPSIKSQQFVLLFFSPKLPELLR